MHHIRNDFMYYQRTKKITVEIQEEKFNLFLPSLQ